MDIKNEILIIILWFFIWLLLDELVKKNQVLYKYRIQISIIIIFVILIYLKKIDI